MCSTHLSEFGVFVDLFKNPRADCLYFLTHGHTDHFSHLKARRSPFPGTVVASAPTIKLLKRICNVPKTIVVDETPTRVGRVVVRAIPAGHCHGSVMFLFNVPDGRRVLYTGDWLPGPRRLDFAVDEVLVDGSYGERELVDVDTDAIFKDVVAQWPRGKIYVHVFTSGVELFFAKHGIPFTVDKSVPDVARHLIEDLSVPRSRFVLVGKTHPGRPAISLSAGPFLCRGWDPTEPHTSNGVTHIYRRNHATATENDALVNGLGSQRTESCYAEFTCDA